MAERILMNEYKSLSKEPWTNIKLINDNIFEWNVALIVLNPDSVYYGGYFEAQMTFPKNYPYSPPDFIFSRPIFHPNVYPSGHLCISILHPPGEDEMSGETAAERWSPAQRVESVLISILSLLDDAEVSSPANVDAGVMLRKDPTRYKEMVRKDLEASHQDIPDGFVMPTHADAFGAAAAAAEAAAAKNDEYLVNWEDSDVDEDFGGSDSDAADADEDDFDEEDVEQDWKLGERDDGWNG